jgi:hypothetical protein
MSRVYYNRTKGPLALYVKDVDDGEAVSVMLKPGSRWECPEDCEVKNASQMEKRGEIRVREE